MKKFTKKLVASMLSTAMLMGMSLNAFAANSQTQGISVNGYSGPGRQITNTWSVAENGLLNDSETFDFALEYRIMPQRRRRLHQHGRQRQQAEQAPVKHCLMMSYLTELDLQLRDYIISN